MKNKKYHIVETVPKSNTDNASVVEPTQSTGVPQGL